MGKEKSAELQQLLRQESFGFGHFERQIENISTLNMTVMLTGPNIIHSGNKWCQERCEKFCLVSRGRTDSEQICGLLLLSAGL